MIVTLIFTKYKIKNRRHYSLFDNFNFINDLIIVYLHTTNDIAYEIEKLKDRIANFLVVLR